MSPKLESEPPFNGCRYDRLRMYGRVIGLNPNELFVLSREIESGEDPDLIKLFWETVYETVRLKPHMAGDADQAKRLENITERVMGAIARRNFFDMDIMMRNEGSIIDFYIDPSSPESVKFKTLLSQELEKHRESKITEAKVNRLRIPGREKLWRDGPPHEPLVRKLRPQS